MGKRELLLIVGFILVGTVLYQATAPSTPAGGGFSLRDMFRAAQRELGDNAASRDVTRDSRLTADASVEVLHIGDFQGRVEVTGVDGDEVRVSTTLTLRGLDDTDLARQEDELQMGLVADGPRLDLDMRAASIGRRPDQTMTVELPRRLRLELGGRGVASIAGIAGLRLDEFRGDVTVSEMTGPSTGDHREGRLEFGEGSHVDIQTQRSTLRLVRPAEAKVSVEATDVEVMDAAGPVVIDEERSTLEVIGGTGPLTVRGEGGTIKLRSVSHPVEIDADRLTVSLIMDQPTAVTLAIEADDVDVTLPRGGIDLEAIVERGELRVPSELTATREGEQQRVTSSLEGGGPKVRLTVERGTLTIRKP